MFDQKYIYILKKHLGTYCCSQNSYYYKNNHIFQNMGKCCFYKSLEIENKTSPMKKFSFSIMVRVLIVVAKTVFITKIFLFFKIW